MSSWQAEKRIRKYSEEVIKLTKDVKDYTQSYNPWEDAGANLVGMISTESLDKIPSYRIDWTNEYTIKTASQMEGARSIIVLGYHASDDIYEAILRKARAQTGVPAPVHVSTQYHLCTNKNYEEWHCNLTVFRFPKFS